LPENKETLLFYLKIWEKIYEKNANIYFTCEFGPQPYMIALPHSQKDITDLEQVNLNMAYILK